MSDSSPFRPEGQTFTVTVGVASQATIVTLASIGCSQFPRALRVVNKGTADCMIDIASAARTAAFPVAGTTTPGTPANGMRALPGVVEVWLAANASSKNVDGLGNPGFVINTISGTAGQPVDFTPGEGS